MKKQIIFFSTILVVLTLLVGPLATIGAQPALELEDDIEASIAAGLAWLAAQQEVDGGWGTGCDRVARTGLAVLKFETFAIENGIDPLDPGYDYYDQVSGGLDYLMTNIQDGSLLGGVGKFFMQPWPCDYHEIYNTGIAMMALASSGHPEIFGADLQGAVDFIVWAQADDECADDDPHFGGWRYGVNQCNSDNSNTGYVTLGLGFAQAPPPYGFGLTVPQTTKDKLSIWIDVIQDDVNGDADDGGSWYDPYWSWVNILKTGNLLYEMGLVGDTVDDQRVKDAIDYIERHWYDGGYCGTGWMDHRQAMFTMMKGFEGLGIEFIDLDDDGIAEHEWFPEVATHLVTTQNPDGSWPSDCWGDQILSTAWALLTLERAVQAFEVPVAVDIKPGSCPNPLNNKSKGVLPVAIVGTDEFDVMQVDPATVMLRLAPDAEEGVAPLRWAYEYTAIPYEPYLEKPLDRYACLEYEESDGYLDLTLKFESQEVSALLEGVGEEVVALYLTGNLKEEFGGTPIVGEDIVWLLANK